MSKLQFITLVLALLAVSSCESHRWPPFENDLREMFAQSSATLAEIEREMVNDGMPSIGSGLNRAWTRADIPELTDAQTDKYASLFGKLPFYANVLRLDSRTHVKLIDQEALFRDFQFAYVHGDIPDRLPACDAADSFAKCGECYATLDTNWYLEYRWSDGEGIPSPDGCIDPESLDFDVQ